MNSFTVDDIFDFLNFSGYEWDFLIYNEKLNNFVKAKESDFSNNEYNLLSLKHRPGRVATVYSCLISPSAFEIYGFDNYSVKIYLEKSLSKNWVDYLNSQKSTK